MDLFREWDTDGSGIITAAEFERALTALGLDAPKGAVIALFDEFDADGDGHREVDRTRIRDAGGISFQALNTVLRRARASASPTRAPHVGFSSEGAAAAAIPRGYEGQVEPAAGGREEGGRRRWARSGGAREARDGGGGGTPKPSPRGTPRGKKGGGGATPKGTPRKGVFAADRTPRGGTPRGTPRSRSASPRKSPATPRWRRRSEEDERVARRDAAAEAGVDPRGGRGGGGGGGGGGGAARARAPREDRGAISRGAPRVDPRARQRGDPHAGEGARQRGAGDDDGARRRRDRDADRRPPIPRRQAGARAAGARRGAARRRQGRAAPQPNPLERRKSQAEVAAEVDLELLISKLNANMGRVIDLFRAWDINENGEISKAEFRKGVIATLGITPSREELAALFAFLDPDGSGTIDYRELDAKLRRREVHHHPLINPEKPPSKPASRRPPRAAPCRPSPLYPSRWSPRPWRRSRRAPLGSGRRRAWRARRCRAGSARTSEWWARRCAPWRPAAARRTRTTRERRAARWRASGRWPRRLRARWRWAASAPPSASRRRGARRTCGRR